MNRKRVIAVLTLCFLLTLWGCQAQSSSESEPEAEASSQTAEETSTPPSASPQPSAPEATALPQREQNWIEDLEFLRTEYKKLHIKPFYFVEEEEFDFKIDQLKRHVAEISDENMFFEIQAVLSDFNDPHLRLNDVQLYDEVMPIDTVCCGDKIYLESYLEGYEELAPYYLQEIVAIDGIDIGYIQEKAESILYPSNPWFNKERLPTLLYTPRFLDWVGCGLDEGEKGENSSYTYHILNDANQVEKVEISPLAYSQTEEKELRIPEGYQYPDSQLYRAQNEAEYIEDERGGYVILHFPDMDSGEREFYDSFFDNGKELLEAHPGCKLIVDLRKNGGGQSVVHSYTRDEITSWRELEISQTYILTGGGMASASIELSTVFKDVLNAIAVGEPTGQFHATLGGDQQIELPHSKLRITVPDAWFNGIHPKNDFVYDEHNKLYLWENTVMPDVYVALDVEDMRQGKDSVVEWVLDH